jgi:alkylation response protein AidB-like acyl-CoA dehydrogenase
MVVPPLDLIDFDSLLSDEERDIRSLARRVADDRVRPFVAEWYEQGRVPVRELALEFGKLGLLGMHLTGYGCAGASAVAYGLACSELEAADSGVRSLVSVQGSLAMYAIWKYGSEEQKQRWLPGMAAGELIGCFGLTEPDHGSDPAGMRTRAERDGSDWVLNGRKIYVSGVDHADAILIVARTEDARTGRLKPALFAFPTDTPGFEYTAIDMDVVMPEKQFLLFLDDVRLPADALIGTEDAALAQLFAGLNPERILAAAGSVGMGRYALDRAVKYANEREVWGKPIGTHQGLAHPLAKAKVELELAKLMMQKAATLYDSGDDSADSGAVGESANMAKYAAAEASIACVDQAVQTLGGNGLAHEYGLGSLLIGARVARIAPVSREMILNFVAQFSLGLPKSF